MSAKGRSRVVVNCNGETREIFSIAEKPSGDLMVFLRPGEHVEEEGEDQTKIKQQRYSIHMSPNNLTINLIKQTYEFYDGTIQESYLYSAAVYNKIFCDIYCMYCPDLTIDRCIPKTKSRDILIDLCIIDTKKQTLIYGLIVTSNQNPDSIPGFGKFETRIIEFENFRVVVWFTFLFLPAMPNSWLIHSTNRRLLRNKINIPFVVAKTGGVHRGHDPLEVRTLIEANILRLVKKYFERTKLMDVKLPERIKLLLLEGGIGTFSPNQLERRLGKAARRIINSISS